MTLLLYPYNGHAAVLNIRVGAAGYVFFPTFPYNPPRPSTRRNCTNHPRVPPDIRVVRTCRRESGSHVLRLSSSADPEHVCCIIILLFLVIPDHRPLRMLHIKRV